MKLNFKIYILLVIICIGMVFPLSNKKHFHYQALLHFITGIFMYLILVTKHDRNYNFAKYKQRKKEIETYEQLECLKTKACNLSATEGECNSYIRCKWDSKEDNCKVRIECKELNNYECMHSDYCEWNVNVDEVGKSSCSYKTSVKKTPTEKPEKSEYKIFNEDVKANRYCFMNNQEYVPKEYDEKEDFVEDKIYKTCENTCNSKQDKEKCINNCKKEAINRLSCNTIKGMKYYQNGVCKRDRNYIPPLKKKNLKCLKVANHSHDNPNEAGYMPHAPGYRTAKSFKINDDRKLRYMINSFILLFIILLNIGIIKLFKN